MLYNRYLPLSILLFKKAVLGTPILNFIALSEC